MTLGRFSGASTAKVECPYCPAYVFPGNLERHTRACLERANRKRDRDRRQLQLPGVGRMRLLMDATWIGEPEIVVEPVCEVDSALHGPSWRCRFLDERGYWDEGDFPLGHIEAIIPELEPEETPA